MCGFEFIWFVVFWRHFKHYHHRFMIQMSPLLPSSSRMHFVFYGRPYSSTSIYNQLQAIRITLKSTNIVRHTSIWVIQFGVYVHVHRCVRMWVCVYVLVSMSVSNASNWCAIVIYFSFRLPSNKLFTHIHTVDFKTREPTKWAIWIKCVRCTKTTSSSHHDSHTHTHTRYAHTHNHRKSLRSYRTLLASKINRPTTDQIVPPTHAHTLTSQRTNTCTAGTDGRQTDGVDIRIYTRIPLAT